MAKPATNGSLPHLSISDKAEDRAFSRRGRADTKIRPVTDRAQHGRKLTDELAHSFDASDELRDQITLPLDELKAVGSVVVLEGVGAAFPLKLDSLERLSSHTKRPKMPYWLLLSVSPATESRPERASVWIDDQYRGKFLALFQEYLTKESAKSGNPRNLELVANITRIRDAVAQDLWQSDGAIPTGVAWWELWLRSTPDAVRLASEYLASRNAVIASRVLRLRDRIVIWTKASWSDLEPLPFTAVPLAEIRRPEFADTVEDLSVEDQTLLIEDLADRITPAGPDAPAVCHLDTGVRRSHVLLEQSLSPDDMHSIVSDPAGADVRNHGTPMAGLALFGPIDDLLLGTSQVVLQHRLESVKFLPDNTGHEPRAYGLVTAQAVAEPEIAAPHRARVFAMPITAPPELPGAPTLWSATVDALAAGVAVGRSDDGIELLGAPEESAARLFVVSAGNVSPHEFQADYQAACDTSPIEDPAQSWNALTVGAHTELSALPTDPSYEGWSTLSSAGDISPHSRTSLLFGKRAWPVKPDICMEGGNVLTDGTYFESSHPLVSVRTTDAAHDGAIGSANATSAATAQAARLAAMAQARYPSFWPETIRALMTHSAEWTPTMKSEIRSATSKTARLTMLRRYGWGVPNEARLLGSSRNAATLVTQDRFKPFEGPKFSVRTFRLHQLPWPVDELQALGASDVALRVTLSYFIEPTASRRGWRKRYAYASHGLRFELKAPTDNTVQEFVKRVNRQAQTEEDSGASSGQAGRWLVGPNQRNVGSLHQDIWEGSGADLAASGVLAVYAVGGWWKNNGRPDRADLPVRYSLVVSLATENSEIDLYTPIATQIGVPIPG